MRLYSGTSKQFIQDTLSTIDLEEFDAVEIPRGAEVDPEDEDGWLYDSERDYLTQMSEYKAHKQG